MNKFMLALAVTSSLAAPAFAGGLNQAVEEEVVEVQETKKGSGILVPLLIVGVLAAVAASANKTNP